MTKNKAMMMVGLVLLLVLAMTSQAFASDAKIGVKLEIFTKSGTELKDGDSLNTGDEFYLDISFNCTGAAANEYIMGYGIFVDYRGCRSSLDRITKDGNAPNDTNQFTELTTGADKLVTGVPTVTPISISNNSGIIGATNVNASGKLVNSVLNNTYKSFIRYYFKAKKAINVSDLEFLVCRTKINVAGVSYTITEFYGRAGEIVRGSYDKVYFEFEETNIPDVPPDYKTVTFDSNGGNPVTPSTQTVRSGGVINPLPTTLKSGSKFAGWFTSDGVGFTSSTPVNANITVHAEWTTDGSNPIVSGPGNNKGTADDVDFTTIAAQYIEVTGAWAKLNAGEKRSLTVGKATITVPDNFCVGLEGIKGEDILKIYLGGENDAYRVYVTVNDHEYNWINPGYPITLVVETALGNAANADSLVAYDTTDSNRIIPFSRYLLTTQKVTIRLMKSANLGLVVNTISFTDTTGLWMDEAVRFMAARGIVKGVDTTVNRFDFRSNMSIRDYVLMSMRMFGYKVDDVPGAANYYQVSWDLAKNLGLLANIDNQNSDPITRQQMFLITARLLNKFNFIPAKVEGNSLAKFTDGDKVADYAKDLINSLVAKNLVRGDANNPTLRLPDKSTRAEAAQFLYNIFKDIM